MIIYVCMHVPVQLRKFRMNFIHNWTKTNYVFTIFLENRLFSFNSQGTRNFPFSYFAFCSLVFSQMIKDIKKPKYVHKTRNNYLEVGKEINSQQWKQVVVKSVRILAQKGKMAFKTPIVPRELIIVGLIKLYDYIWFYDSAQIIRIIEKYGSTEFIFFKFSTWFVFDISHL